MFQRIPVMIGQYRPLSSYMHQIDARAKLLPILLLFTLILFTDSILFYLVMTVALFPLFLFSGLNLTILKANFKPLLLFIAFTSVYHLLFSGKDTEALFTVFNVSLYKGAVSSALFYSLRLVLFLSSAFFITLTCSPSELSEAVTKLLKPLELLKFPLSDFTLILFISIRFIPILYEEFHNIRNAQQIRGVTFSGSFITKILDLKSLIIPIFLSSIRRADALTDALVVRGYNSKRERTFYTTHKLTLADISFLILLISFIIILYYFIG